MKIRIITSEVTLALDADEAAGTAVFSPDNATAFAQEFEFSQIGELSMDEPQVPVWAATRGQLKLADRVVRIAQVRGSQTDLTVQVDGESSDADSALQAIWRSLSKLQKEVHRPVETVGTCLYQTTAIVELNQSFESLFPAAEFLRRRVMSAIDQTPFRGPERVHHRYGFEVPLSLGHRSIPRKFTLEPRVQATGETVFWTRSPLPSTEHLAILEALEKRK